MQFYWFLLGTLAVWRITHLLGFEDGPWDLLERMRAMLGHGMVRKMFACFYCLSLWVALLVALFLGETRRAKLLLWPALSGAAIWVERTAGNEPHADSNANAVYYEDPQEEQRHVLR
jgi:hypothetical protein